MITTFFLDRLNWVFYLRQYSYSSSKDGFIVGINNLSELYFMWNNSIIQIYKFAQKIKYDDKPIRGNGNHSHQKSIPPWVASAPPQVDVCPNRKALTQKHNLKGNSPFYQ